jgi:hypothetical protein
LVRDEAAQGQQQPQQQVTAAQRLRQMLNDSADANNVQAKEVLEIEKMIEASEAQRAQEAAQQAATAANAEEAEAQAERAAGVAAGAMSWARHFFEDARDNKKKCLLAPLPYDGEAKKKARPHRQLLSNDRKTLIQHITECSWHHSAYAFYQARKADGMSDADAAGRTIEWARGVDDKNVQKLTQGSKPAKHSPSEAEKDFVREVSFLCWVAEKNLSFNSVESDALHEYHAAFGWRDAPGRKRLSGPLLDQVSGLVDKHRAAKLGDIDYFSITTDAATLTHQKATTTW